MFIDNLHINKINYDDHNTFYFTILYVNNSDSNIYMTLINSVGQVVVNPWRITTATDIGTYVDYSSLTSMSTRIDYTDLYND